MEFPLYTKTYSISERTYRRNPYTGKDSAQTVDSGDTVDLYADDYEDEALDCLPDLGKVSSDSESEANETASTISKSKPKGKPVAAQASAPIKTVTPSAASSSDVEPALTMAPPPGFEDKIPTAKEPQSLKSKKTFTKGETVTVVDWYKCEQDQRIEHNGQKWRARIEVASAFFGRLIGPRGLVLREMESSTQCRVRIPGREQKSEVIEISSTIAFENVSRCLDRIDIIVIKAKKESRPTHFACFRMNEPSIVESYERFKELVKTNDSISETCKDDRLYMLSKKLHLTLAVMRLFTKEDKAMASEAISVIGEKLKILTDGKSISADISGLRIMNDDPANVDVLYGNVNGDMVQKAANVVRDVFVEKGLCEPDASDVKLHMTLMNSRYLAEENVKTKRTPFDAKVVLAELGDFSFGSILIDKVYICSMHSQDSDGFYETLGSLNL